MMARKRSQLELSGRFFVALFPRMQGRGSSVHRSSPNGPQGD